jgi:hypothetical protein
MLPHDETGSGPAAVLLHAGVADRTMWTEHLQPLADAGYRALPCICRASGAVALRVALVAPECVSALVVVSAPAPLRDR